MSRSAELAERSRERYVGRSVERLEDERILAGNSAYLDDIELPDLLYAKLWRSPQAHAEVASVDVSGALAMAGVVDAITGADLAETADAYGHRRSGLARADRRALTTDRVRFAGEGVAAVAAESPYRAGDALEAVEVELDRLPVMLRAREALDGPAIHPDLADDPDVDGNAWGHHSIDVGDVGAAFDRADHVIDHRVRTNRPAAVPLEPHAAIADYDAGSGKLTLYATTQEAHSLQSDLAKALGKPLNEVRVVQPPNMGGGFGHKLTLHDHEVVAAVLSMRTGRPVKVVLDRHEEFSSTWARQPQVHELSLALADDGEFLAVRDDITAEAGGYCGLTKPGLVYSALTVAAPYWIEHVAVEGRCVFTNTVPSSAYRGFGFTQATIARESLVDRAADELGIDPWALRRRNVIDDADCPTTHPLGFEWDSFGIAECIDLVDGAIDRSLLGAAPDGHRRGLGVALGMHVSSVQRPSYTSDNGAVTLRMAEDGSVTVYSDQCPMGTGIQTALAQIVADELGIGYDELEFVFGDTDSAPFGLGSWGSRGVVIAGTAAQLAARTLGDRLRAIAAHQLGADPGELELADGALRGPDDALSLADLAYDAHYNGRHLPDGMTAGPLVVTESYDNPAPGPLDDSGRNDPAVNYPCGAHAVVVDVDTRTGYVDILDYAVADDVGRVINPMVLEGQIQGGVVQGIGMALGEDLVYDEGGQLITGNLEEYRLPLIGETPMLTKIDEADTVSTRSPLGAKGVGESGLTIAPGAILNAVNDALGTHVSELPLDPPRVHDAAAGRGD